RRRDPADLDGPRRYPAGVRYRAYPRGGRRRQRAGDRFGRGRHARPPGRRHPRRACSRGPGGLDLPFRRILDRTGQVPHAARRPGGPRRDLTDPHGRAIRRDKRGTQDMAKEDSGVLERLYDVIESRRGADPDSSRTARLFARGTAKIAQKVGEEAVETVIEGVRGDRRKLVTESA